MQWGALAGYDSGHTPPVVVEESVGKRDVLRTQELKKQVESEAANRPPSSLGEDVDPFAGEYQVAAAAAPPAAAAGAAAAAGPHTLHPSSIQYILSG